MPPKRFWHELTTYDFREPGVADWIAILPVAAIEQHGREAYPHECCGALLGEGDVVVDAAGRQVRLPAREPPERGRRPVEDEVLTALDRDRLDEAPTAALLARHLDGDR